MALPSKSQKELYDLFIESLQSNAPELTDTLDGSTIDILAGVFSIAATEVQRNTQVQFNKTFLDLADGPEITQGPDDLQTLAVDHYGSAFARPGAIAAIDTVTFTRPDNSNGEVLIPAGTIVKTAPDANGTAQRYSTDSDVTLTDVSAASDLTVSVSVTAVVAGKAGNATAGTINVIESTLLDDTIVCANTGNATGADAEDDSTYRETIRNLIEALAGATLAAIEAKAKTVTGVVTATAIEQAITVIAYNPSTHTTSGSYFFIPKAILYISDSTGTASVALLNAVRAAIKSVRAGGVFITVAPGAASSVNWTASIVLDPMGPDYATLSNDTSAITTAMENYIAALPVGTSFVRATANAAILAIFGPAGSGDLVSNGFTTSVPSGDVSASATTKFVPGTMSIV